MKLIWNSANIRRIHGNPSARIWIRNADKPTNSMVNVSSVMNRTVKLKTKTRYTREERK